LGRQSSRGFVVEKEGGILIGKSAGICAVMKYV
jgi:hypothetical protein